MKRTIKYISLILLLFSFVGVVNSTSYNISSCQEINMPGDYFLTNNIQSNSTCINITTENVNLNCNGFNIIGNLKPYIEDTPFIIPNFAGMEINSSNIRINNCNITTLHNSIRIENDEMKLQNISITNIEFNNTYNAVTIWNINNLVFENITIKNKNYYGENLIKIESVQNGIINNLNLEKSHFYLFTSKNITIENSSINNSQISFTLLENIDLDIHNITMENISYAAFEYYEFSPLNYSKYKYNISNINIIGENNLNILRLNTDNYSCIDYYFTNITYKNNTKDLISIPQLNLTNINSKINNSYKIIICDANAYEISNLDFNNIDLDIITGYQLDFNNNSNINKLNVNQCNSCYFNHIEPNYFSIGNGNNLYINDSTINYINNISNSYLNNIKMNYFTPNPKLRIYEGYNNKIENSSFSNLDIKNGNKFEILNNNIQDPYFFISNSNISNNNFYSESSFYILNSTFSNNTFYDELYFEIDNTTWYNNKFYSTPEITGTDNLFNYSINATTNIGNYWYYDGPANWIYSTRPNLYGYPDCFEYIQDGEYKICTNPSNYTINNITDYHPLTEKYILSINTTIISEGKNFSTDKKSIPIFMNLTKPIISFKYIIDNISYDISNQAKNDSINKIFNLTIPKYGYNTIIFHIKDEDSFQVNVNTNNTLTFFSFLNLTSLPDDLDGDGVNDSQDNILGNISNIYTTTNLSIAINNDTNLSKIFNDTINITFASNGKKLIEITKNISNITLDLTNITIFKEENEYVSKLLISGIPLSQNETKVIYLNLQNDSRFTSLCLKDAEITSFEEITPACNQDNEYLVKSIPYINGNLSVTYENQSEFLIKITGLKHSAVTQICSENWTYTNWSLCTNNMQTRNATDSNNCGTNAFLEVTSRSCGGGGSSSKIKSTNNSNNNNDTIIKNETKIVELPLEIKSNNATNYENNTKTNSYETSIEIIEPEETNLNNNDEKIENSSNKLITFYQSYKLTLNLIIGAIGLILFIYIIK